MPTATRKPSDSDLNFFQKGVEIFHFLRPKFPVTAANNKLLIQLVCTGFAVWEGYYVSTLHASWIMIGVIAIECSFQLVAPWREKNNEPSQENPT